MRPLLITGATGQVGLALVRAAGPLPVIAVGHRDLDVTDRAAVATAVADIEPAAVVNLAAYTAVDRAEDEADVAMAVNRDGADNVAQACAGRGTPLLHVSTDYVFDGTSTRPWTEDDPTGPLNVYGASKLAGEEAVRRHERHLIVRTSWIFSAEGTNFVKTMFTLRREPELHIVDDQHGGPTPAADLATFLLHLAVRVHEGAPITWGTYHYSGAPATSWFGFARAIFDHVSDAPRLLPVPTSARPRPAARPANSVLDNRRTAQAFNVPQPDWRPPLRQVVEQLTDD